jgi:hypothetical protein
MTRTLALATAGLLLAHGVASAATAAPSITGMWDFQGRVQSDRIKPVPPPVTPEVKAIMDKKRAARPPGVNREVSNILCLPTGFPQMMQWKSPIEILETPGRISVLSEHDPGNDEPRTIYLNRKLPAEVDPSWNGYSVGKWEGKTLVVTTIGLNDRGSVGRGVPRTPTTKIVERFDLSAKGKILTDVLTITDPATLTAPWTVTLRYTRMPIDSERFEAVCEPDLDALKLLDLKTVAAYDDEAARLIDPTQQYNPGSR